MGNRRILIASNLLLITLLACNPSVGKPSIESGLAGTTTAQAAALQNAGATPVAAAIPVTGNTLTPSRIHVTVKANANCRTGPGSNYELIFTASPGPSFEVVGKYTPSNYWIINNPTGGTCWLWGQYAVITGDTAELPEYSAPPEPSRVARSTRTAAATSTATSSGSRSPVFPILTLIVPVVPVAPGDLRASRTCTGGFNGFTPMWTEDLTLMWTDSPNDLGYHVYENNAQICILAADSTGYDVQLRYDAGTGGAVYDTFAVEAFNNAGVSTRQSLDIPRCP